VRLIRWQDPALWPDVLELVPPGFVAVTDRDRAGELGYLACGGLAPLQREQYRLLWEAALDTGFQPSGLLVTCLVTLAPVLGHTSATVPKQFARFCVEEKLWVRVPGKLYPHPRGDVRGRRSRCFLVIERAPRPPASSAEGSAQDAKLT
jgi:hypothetical protein